MNSNMKTRFFIGVVALMLSIASHAQTPLFQELSSSQTQVMFENRLTPSDSQHIFIDFNFYNGGGIAIADFDGDGLPDLYFTGNQVGNALYRNLGEMRFEDVTAQSGTKGMGGWNTGVAVADVNQVPCVVHLNPMGLIAGVDAFDQSHGLVINHSD